MDSSLFPDFAQTIRYALTARPGPDGAVEVVLDLFRGAAPALTRVIASVRPGEVAPLLARCRRHLEHHGAHAVRPPAPEPEAEWAMPAAAFDWLFAG